MCLLFGTVNFPLTNLLTFVCGVVFVSPAFAECSFNSYIREVTSVLTGWSVAPFSFNIQSGSHVWVSGVEWLVLVRWDKLSQQSAWQPPSATESISETAGHTVSVGMSWSQVDGTFNDWNCVVKLKATWRRATFLIWSSHRVFVDFCHHHERQQTPAALFILDVINPHLATGINMNWSLHTTQHIFDVFISLTFKSTSQFISIDVCKK